MENEHKILTAGDLLQSFVQMKERRRESPATAPGLLCCLPSRRQEGQEEPRDRVEAAFKKFDSDGDGYIDWEEFKQVGERQKKGFFVLL